MDDVLSVRIHWTDNFGIIVLILVLVDDVLGAESSCTNALVFNQVLILVLVDDVLGGETYYVYQR